MPVLLRSQNKTSICTLFAFILHLICSYLYAICKLSTFYWYLIESYQLTTLYRSHFCGVIIDCACWLDWYTSRAAAAPHHTSYCSWRRLQKNSSVLLLSLLLITRDPNSNKRSEHFWLGRRIKDRLRRPTQYKGHVFSSSFRLRTQKMFNLSGNLCDLFAVIHSYLQLFVLILHPICSYLYKIWKLYILLAFVS
jgi:hypothetical protein